MKVIPFLFTLILITTLANPAGARGSLVVSAGDSLCMNGLELRAGAAPALVCRGTLVLENARLRARRGSSEPLVRVEAGGRLWLKDCRLVDARSAGRAGGRALIELSGGELTLQFSTLRTRSARPFLTLESGAQARLNSCLFSAAIPREMPWFQVDAGSQLEAAWCLSDAHGADSTHNLPQLRGLRAIPAARLVDPALGDLRPRWDSPCLDSGAPGAPLDFDLTRADVGWHPELPEATLSGIVQNLPAGHYDITDDTEIRTAIPAGTVLRVATGKSLTIVPDEAGTITIGDADGARTALVGRPARGLDPSSSIEIHAQGPPECTMNLQGVLFNYPPQNVLDPSFNGVTINLDDVSVSQDIDGRLVRFQNWIGIDQDMDDPSSPLVDGRLTFVYAQGRVHHLAIGDEDNQGPGGLSLLKTNIDVEDCTFQITGTESAANTPPLLMYGACEVETPVLQRNTFVGASQNGNYLADFQQTVLRLTNNSFEDLTYTPIIETHSSLDMSHEARNSLLAAQTFSSGHPIVELENGVLDLYCGRNNFVLSGFGATWPIISWPTIPDEQPEQHIWSQNFWGASCQQPLSDAVLNNRILHLLPPWAHTENSLIQCVEPLDPDNPACPYEIYTAIELLKNGKLAEASFDYVAAKDNFRFLLALYPTSQEANEGSLRLKGLGLNKEYGPEGYTDVAAGLFSAADTSELSQMHQQAVLQDCGGWCVEARWGDRPGALAALSGMLSGEADPICRTTINKAVMEIGTFPVQGGTSALHPQALAARRVERQRAEQTLLTSPRGQAVELEQERGKGPSEFRIVNVHPNPFNPVAILQLAVPADGLVRVRVFNLLGQQVAEPMNQHVQAGQHSLQIDGSRWASGLYVALAEQNGHTSTQKMMLVK
ncbi:MAG: T9SS type A sorting domain-containing protein [Candidatus Delongbacteria bacterium]